MNNLQTLRVSSANWRALHVSVGDCRARSNGIELRARRWFTEPYKRWHVQNGKRCSSAEGGCDVNSHSEVADHGHCIPAKLMSQRTPNWCFPATWHLSLNLASHRVHVSGYVVAPWFPTTATYGCSLAEDACSFVFVVTAWLIGSWRKRCRARLTLSR